jgi:hypothetical protein
VSRCSDHHHYPHLHHHHPHHHPLSILLPAAALGPPPVPGPGAGSAPAAPPAPRVTRALGGARPPPALAVSAPARRPVGTYSRDPLFRLEIVYKTESFGCQDSDTRLYAAQGRSTSVATSAPIRNKEGPAAPRDRLVSRLLNKQI